MTHAVLWIEDSPQGLFAPYLAPILADPDIMLKQTFDATQAFEELKSHSYDLVIFDLDLPPGENRTFQEIYHHCIPNALEKSCVLGYHLLRIWLGQKPKDLPENIPIEDVRLPSPLSPRNILIYSVFAENYLKDLEALGLDGDHIIQKSVHQSRFFLHNKIKESLQRLYRWTMI